MEKLGAFSMMLARCDYHHVAEWIVYHGRIGVSKIMIHYDVSGVDSHYGIRPDGTWNRKPGHPMSMDLSIADVEGLFLSEVERGRRESGIDVVARRNPSKKTSMLNRQKEGFGIVMNDGTFDNHEWVQFLDVDELLVKPGGGLNEFLDEQPPEIDIIRMKQFLFECRFKDGVAIPMQSITKCHGRPRGSRRVYKGIYRSGTLGQLRSVHCVTSPQGIKSRPFSNVIRFHHFRGKVTKEEEEWHRGAIDFNIKEMEDFFNDDHVQ